MDTTWTGTAVMALKIVPRAGGFVNLTGLFTVGVLGSQVAVVGNAALVETVVATANTNTVVGLPDAFVIDAAEATCVAGELSVTT